MIYFIIGILYYLFMIRVSMRRLLENDKRSWGRIDVEDIFFAGFLSLAGGVVYGPYALIANRIERRGDDPGDTFVTLVERAVGVDKPTRGERKQAKIKRLEQRNQELERELGLH